MDALDNDLLEFWKVLNEHKVSYIMVGGFAVLFKDFLALQKTLTFG